jgi:hypothetical protein
MSAITAAMSIASGVAESKAQKQNALFAEAEGEQAMLTGQAESARQARINQAKQSELIAASGASGTTFTGSPMEVYLANAKQAALEEADPLYGATLKQRQAKAQSNIYNRQASSALFGGVAKGVGTLAGGLSSTLLSPTPSPTSAATPPPGRVNEPWHYEPMKTAGIYDPNRYRL